MAGAPPDKDFSNAKPTNQVNANTFLTWVDPFVRPLTGEDIAFERKGKSSNLIPYFVHVPDITEGRPHNPICDATSRKEALHLRYGLEEDGAMSIDNPQRKRQTSVKPGPR